MGSKVKWGPKMRALKARLSSSAAGRLALEQDRVVVEATENLAQAMKQAGVSKAELARRMGVKPPVVSTMLGGKRNFTLATLAHAFHVLGYSMHVDVGSPSDAPRIADVPRLKTPQAARRGRVPVRRRRP
jgi:antitoxin component HigA of HigAB toxin-antitoxin module